MQVRQEATVRNGHGTTDWFQIRKGVHQGCILSRCLFNLYAYRFLRRQVRWSGIPISEFSTVCCDPHSQRLWQVNKTEVDIFLEFPCFFYDLTDVGNEISGSFAFLKSSLYSWKFSIHILLKLRLKDFEHYFASK